MKKGRKAKVVDFRQFEELCKIQCTQLEICAVLDIGIDTLNKLLKVEYGKGFAELREKYKDYGKASLRRMQFKLAERNATLLIWLGKQYLGQSDRIEVDNDEMVNEELEFVSVPKQGNGKYRRFYN